MDTSNNTSGVLTIPLTRGYTTIIDLVDSDLASFKWHTTKVNGGFYARRSRHVSEINEFPNHGIYLHIVIMERILGRAIKSGERVDHQNRDVRDNTRQNLRVCTPTQNSHNSRLHVDNRSGYKGVTWDKARQKWKAQIMVKGKVYNLGRFDTIEEARDAYNSAAESYYQEFAGINDQFLT